MGNNFLIVMRYQPFPNDKTAVVTVRSAGPDGKEAECV